MPYCWNCARSFHPLGIANHRRAHQRRGEEVTISLADGVWTYRPDPDTERLSTETQRRDNPPTDSKGES